MVKAVFGLGIAGADGMGDFSLKTSEVGLWGWCGVVEYRESRVWWNIFRNSSGFGKCSLTWVAMVTG